MIDILTADIYLPLRTESSQFTEKNIKQTASKIIEKLVSTSESPHALTLLV